MKPARKATLFATALTALGCASQTGPTRQLAEELLGQGPAVAGTVSLRVNVTIPPRALLSTTARRWQVDDVNLLRVKLQQHNGSGYVDTGLTQDLSRKVAPIATGANFVNLAAGKRYRTTVEAWGDAGGATAAALLNTQNPASADFDFTVTAGQDLDASRSATVNLQLDAVAFSGTARVALNGKPGSTASVEAQLWVQGGGSALATQALASNVGTAIFGGLRAGPDYEVKLKALDAGSAALAEVASTSFRFDPAAASLVQEVAFGLNFPGGASPSPSPSPSASASPSPSPSPSPGLFSVALANGSFSVQADAQDNLWVSHTSGGLVTRLDSQGAFLGSFTVGSAGDVAFDTQGNVWVSPSSGNRFFKVSSLGSLLASYSVAGTSGGGFVGLAPDGAIWVPRTKDNFVAKFASNGSLLGTFATGVEPFMAIVTPTGEVWVSIFKGASVTRLASNGSLLGNFSVGNSPVGLALDAQSNVWVANSSSATLSKLASNGTRLGTFGVGGTARAIAISDAGEVWVSGSYVTRLSASGSLLGTYSTGGITTGITVTSQGVVWAVRSSPRALVRVFTNT